MIMSIIDEIYDTRNTSIKIKNLRPETIGMSFDDGVRLLREASNNPSGTLDASEIDKMLMRYDREEIKKTLKNVTVYGMKIVISDIIKI